MLAYLKMLVINRIAGWKLSSFGKPNDSKAKKAFKYGGIMLLLLYLYGVVIFLEVLVYNTGMKLGEPQLLIAVTYFGCTMVTLLYSFFYVVSMLFFGKDTMFLGALPISSRSILTSKLTMIIAGEAGLTLLVGAPMLVRFGIETGANALFYVRALIGTLFVPLAPIALSTLLSFLFIRVSALWKRRESMTIVMSFALMIAYLVFMMRFNMSATEDQMSGMVMKLLFNKGSITDMVLSAYPPLQWLVSGVTGVGIAAWGKLLLFVAVSIAAIALVVYLFGGSYLRLALKQQENIRRANAVRYKLGADKRRTPFWALFRQEMREVITVPIYATNCLVGCVMFPVMIVVIALGFKEQMRGFSLMDELLRAVPGGYITAIFTGVMCLTNTMGMAISTAVSREGKRHDMRKTYPISGYTHLGAKLLMGICYNAITTLLSAVALVVLLPGLWSQIVVGFALSMLFTLLYCALSLIWDTYRAKLQWKTETEAVKQNMNSLLSMLVSMVAVALLVGAYILCIRLGLAAEAALAIVCALMLATDLLLMKMLRTKASEAYYRV